MQANQSQLIKLWPFTSIPNNKNESSETAREWGESKIKWWYNKYLETYLPDLLPNCLASSYCTFSPPRNLLPNLNLSPYLSPLNACCFFSLLHNSPFFFSGRPSCGIFFFSFSYAHGYGKSIYMWFTWRFPKDVAPLSFGKWSDPL